MSGVAIVLEFEGLARARAAYGALRDTGADLRPVLDHIGGELESSTIRRFDTNVAPDGTPWKPSRRALTKGGYTLVEEGHLRDSIHYFVDGDSAVEVATAMEYAAIHQAGFDDTIEVRAHERTFSMVFGRPFSGKATVGAHSRHMKMPARPYLGLSADDVDAIEDALVDHYRMAVVRGLG